MTIYNCWDGSHFKPSSILKSVRQVVKPHFLGLKQPRYSQLLGRSHIVDSHKQRTSWFQSAHPIPRIPCCVFGALTRKAKPGAPGSGREGKSGSDEWNWGTPVHNYVLLKIKSNFDEFRSFPWLSWLKNPQFVKTLHILGLHCSMYWHVLTCIGTWSIQLPPLPFSQNVHHQVPTTPPRALATSANSFARPEMVGLATAMRDGDPWKIGPTIPAP